MVQPICKFHFRHLRGNDGGRMIMMKGNKMKKRVGLAVMLLLLLLTVFLTSAAADVLKPSIYDNRGGAYGMNFYLGMDFEKGTFYEGRVQTEPQIDHFYVNNAEELKAAHPDGAAAWTLEKIDGTAELEMDLSMLPDMDLQLKKLPEGPEEARWKITFRYGDASWETVYAIQFQNSPTGLPTGLDLSFGDTLTVKTGEKIGINEKVSFKNNWSIPGESIYTMIGGGSDWQEGITHDENWVWDVANKPGLYSCNVSKTCGNIRWIEPFTLIVTDENGEIPKTTPEVVGN